MYMINSLIFWEFINTIRSNPILSKLSNLGMQNFMEYPRLEIYSSSLNLISQKPIWGYGSGTFPAIYELEGGLYNAQHTHNLPLQIAYDFGIPTAFIICFIVTYL